MDNRPSHEENSNPEEDKPNNPSDTSINEKLKYALDKVDRSDAVPQTSQDAQDQSVVVSEALAIANEKLNKLQSEEKQNTEAIQETKNIIDDLETKKRELREKAEQMQEIEMATKQFLNTTEDLGNRLYQLHMILTEREDKGMNPLVTTEPLGKVSKELLTATDRRPSINEVMDIIDTLGRGMHNMEMLRSQGQVREDPDNLEDILRLVREAAEEIDTLQKQTSSKHFGEEESNSIQRVLEETERIIDGVGNRVHKKLNALGGY